MSWIDFIVSECDFALQLYNRLMATVNNASFLAHLEKLQDESAHQHAELSSGNMTGLNLINILKFVCKLCVLITSGSSFAFCQSVRTLIHLHFLL